MIHRVFSTMDDFKDLEFKPGLNVLLADKTAASNDLQTRNRAGKTSLIELIHFVLGSKAEPGSLFRDPAIAGETFGLAFDLGGQRVTASRSGAKATDVRVEAADPSGWPHQPNAKGVLSNPKWQDVLGAVMFDLPVGEDQGAWAPKFRQLFAYFVRRQLSGGLTSPFKQAAQQGTGDSQVALSYLLGLDWTVSQQWQRVRERERMLREIKKAAGTTDLGGIVGDPAALRTRLAVVQDRAGRLQESVSRFDVVPEYRELEAEASRLTRTLGELADGNTSDRTLAAELSAATQAERAPSYDDLQAVYQEAGVALPGVALRSFEDAAAFHASVVDNRRLYLGGEIDEALGRIEERERQMARLDARRAEIMGVLNAGGALDQYSALRSELSRFEGEVENLRSQIDTAENLQGQKAELDIERQRLLLRLNQDVREQRRRVDEAIVTFEDVSASLYEEAGSLIVDVSDDGPQFDVRIQGQKSKGVRSMQIFSFDVALMRLCAARGMGPGFLVHDSHLFDGVDERQVLAALEVGKRMAIEYGFQYIVTMNSDAMPKMKAASGFDLASFVNPVRLTDATEDGGLFGIRFG